MNQSQEISELFGVNISDFHAVELTKEKFSSVDFSQYSEGDIHLLIHAIQFQHPIPSLKTITRTNNKNKRKAAAKNGGIYHPVKTVKQAKGAKHAPKNFRKRLPVVPINYPRLSSDSRVISTDAESLKAFKTLSPQEIALKSARQVCAVQLKQWKQEFISNKQEMIGEKKLPDYFRNKHQSKKRRLKQRRELISANLQQLKALYGDEIKKNRGGWVQKISEKSLVFREKMKAWTSSRMLENY